MISSRIAEIALFAPLPGPLMYSIPFDLSEQIHVGSQVQVLLKKKRVVGVVLRFLKEKEVIAFQKENLKLLLTEIQKKISDIPLPADIVYLVSFIADYYCVSYGDALRLVWPFPKSLEKKSSSKIQLSDASFSQQLRTLFLPPGSENLTAIEKNLLFELQKEPTQSISIRSLRKKFTDPKLKAQVEQSLEHLRQLNWVQEVDDFHSTWNRMSVVSITTEQKIQEVIEREQMKMLARAPVQAALLQKLKKEGPLPIYVLSSTYPGAVNSIKALLEKQWITLLTPKQSSVRVEDFTDFSNTAPSDSELIPELTTEQNDVLLPLVGALRKTNKENSIDKQPYKGAFLLHGVTGSGKTEIYLRIIAEALKQNMTAIVLVPEIALTPQILKRFNARFPGRVAMLHSSLTTKEREQVWQRMLEGKVQIALGPRSVLFSPLSNLGVIIVDEEHDTSFKQQEGVWYHARDIALVRGQQSKSVVILGSATPSLESLFLVKQGKLQILTLVTRISSHGLPQVELIDLRKYPSCIKNSFLSEPLEQAIEETLARKEQVLLFLNRRGYATLLFCQACGYRFECKNCSVTLTWHKEACRLMCHYCGYKIHIPEKCPKCSQPKILQLGTGTQRVEEQLLQRFPDARIVRLDRDTSKKQELVSILDKMNNREIDILLGTQMLAKGHDFGGVTLVGVLLADMAMHLPDFRAAERTFQILTQVAGRAGRGEQAGRVLIQTFVPEHPAILHALHHDSNAFSQEELKIRQERFYPPFCRMAALRLDGFDYLSVQRCAEVVANYLKEKISNLPMGTKIDFLGPAPAPISRLKGRIRHQIFIRATTIKSLRTLVKEVACLEIQDDVRLHIDMDPVSML